jgi:hypothetical protein
MFNEENTVETIIPEILCGSMTSKIVVEKQPRPHTAVPVKSMRQNNRQVTGCLLNTL